MATTLAKLTPPEGEAITLGPRGLITPDHPIIPFVRGDGIGPEVWDAASRAAEAAVAAAYGGKRAIAWFEVYAGVGAVERYGEGETMPADTLAAIRAYRVAIKGPLATPVGGGARSVNVALRQELDLYANVRPVRYLPGLPSPLKSPERIDLTIFRENTEDVYCGVEWPADSPEAKEVIDLVNTRLMPKKRPLAAAAAIGIKPITRRASERLVRAAIRYAVRDRRPSVTLVHKGNIMKFTEGGFLKWGYELAKAEFGDAVVTERELKDCGKTLPPAGKILLKDRIADNMFQELILKPDEHSVIATTNLNGDYLSDAAAALIGGLGFAAGANFSDELAVFEAVHGAAPDIACQDVANPSAMMLTQRELLAHLGWHEAADRLFGAVKAVVSRGWVTADVACYLPNVTPLSCSEFAAAVCEEIAKRTG